MAENTTVVGAGETYTTIAGWESAFQADITAAGSNINEVALLKAELFDEDLVIDGWTTDSTHYVELRADSGAKFEVESFTGAEVAQSANFGVDNYEVSRYTNIRVGDPLYTKPVFPRASSECVVDRCVIQGLPELFDTSEDYLITNSIIYVPAAYAATDSMFASSGVHVVHCTIICNNNHGRIFDTSPTSYNNVVYNADSTTTNDNYSNMSAGDYNATSEGTIYGSFGQTDITTSDFADYANEDFHIADTGSDLYGNGSDQTSTYPTTTVDFDGVTRSSFDIGAFEFVAASSSIPIFMNNYRQRRR